MINYNKDKINKKGGNNPSVGLCVSAKKESEVL
jgi:hypothetical protein